MGWECPLTTAPQPLLISRVTLLFFVIWFPFAHCPYKGSSLERSCLAASRDKLRQNPLENRAISVFNGQKPCTKITLSILQSFLHDIMVAWNTTKYNFPWEIEKIEFKAQRNCANTGQILSSVSFYQYFRVFHMNSKTCFRHCGFR